MPDSDPCAEQIRALEERLGAVEAEVAGVREDVSELAERHDASTERLVGLLEQRGRASERCQDLVGEALRRGPGLMQASVRPLMVVAVIVGLVAGTVQAGEVVGVVLDRVLPPVAAEVVEVAP